MSQQWMNHKRWSSPVVYSQAKLELWVGFCISLLFLGLSVALVVFSFDQLQKEFGRGNYLLLLMLLFPLGGLLGLRSSLKGLVNWRYFGKAPLHLDPYPASLGGDMGGYVDVAVPFDRAHSYSAQLILYRSEWRNTSSGSSKGRTKSSSVKWEAKVPLHVEPCVVGGRSGTRVRLQIELPEHLPASELPHGEYHYWHLLLTSEQGKRTLQRAYEIPVFATAQKMSVPLPRTALMDFEDEQLNHLEALSHITQQGDTVWMRFTPQNMRKLFAGLSLGGGVFFAIGVGLGFMKQAHAHLPWLFVVMFGLIGGLIFLVGLYGLGSELRVAISPKQIKIKRFWFGVALSDRQYSRTQVGKLRLYEHGSMSSGRRVVKYYALRVALNSGRPLMVASGINGYGLARKLGEQLSVLTGLPFDERSK